MKKIVVKITLKVMAVMLCFALLPLTAFATPAETGNSFNVKEYVYFADYDGLVDFVKMNAGKTATDVCDDEAKLGAYEFILSGKGFIYLPNRFDGFPKEQWVNGIVENTGIYIGDSRIIVIGAVGNQKYMLTCIYGDSADVGTLSGGVYQAGGIDGDVSFALGGGASYYIWQQDGYQFSLWVVDGLTFDEFSYMLPAKKVPLMTDIAINEPAQATLEEIE